MPSKVSNTKSDAPKSRAKRGPVAKPNSSAKTATSSSTPSGETPAPAAKPEPKAPVETVSLIEPKTKKVRVAESEGAAKKRALPTIGRVVVPKAPVAEPAPPEVVIRVEPEVLSLIEKRVRKPAASAPAAEIPASTEEPRSVPTESTDVSTEDGRKVVHLKPPITVKDLAAQMELRPFKLIADLMDLNIFAAINQVIEPDIAAKVCEKHGFIFEREKRQAGAGVHKVETLVVEPPPPPEEVLPEVLETLEVRAPIITLMGHVDHGKTSLLDAIRRSRVATGEAGGITQHIGAYSVERDSSRITFLDTPGHAAFSAMRARGANVTDIVVIVVAADDGLMPQTIEAINHAKAANVMIMVAINKVDLVSANIDRVKAQLQEQGLTPEDWGGETICCEVSATKGIGIDALLESMVLQAEVMELKADPKSDARCIVIEAQVESGRGPTATVIVKIGTIRVGQPFICGNQWGKVKQLINDLGKPIKEAGPATPVKVLGFSGLPHAGDELVAMDNEKSVRALGEERLQKLRTQKLAAPQRATLENLYQSLADEKKKTLQIVLKADVQGSLEAVNSSLKEITSDKISLSIIHAAVGPVSESDVLLCSASNAVIVGFGVKVENSAASTAKREGVQIKLFSIIYELLDQVRESLTGMLDPELRETVVGHAEVKQVFELSKGCVAGCIVTDGRIPRTARARVIRRKQAVYDGGIHTLRRFQDDVKEVRNGLECGIRLGDFNDYEVGDIIQAYNLDKVAQVL
jgi:translation initiation factor IF-2